MVFENKTEILFYCIRNFGLSFSLLTTWFSHSRSLSLSYLSYFAQFGFTRCLRNASLLFLVLSNFQPNSHTLAQCSFSAQTTRKSTTQMHRKYIRCLSCVTSEIILANEHGNKKTRIKTKLGMGKFLQIIEYECRACKSLQPTKSVQIKFIHICLLNKIHARAHIAHHITSYVN